MYRTTPLHLKRGLNVDPNIGQLSDIETIATAPPPPRQWL
jgi:hypothetical protein